MSDQLNALVSAPSEKLGIGLIVSVLIAVWSATSGTSAMMNALTIAYEGKEDRGVLHFYGLAMALTIGGVIFVVAALLLIAGVPAAAVTRLSLPPLWQDILPSIRFPMLAVLAFLGLGTLYRLAPHRKQPAWDFPAPRHDCGQPYMAGRLGGVFFLRRAFRLLRPHLRLAGGGRDHARMALRQRLYRAGGRRTEAAESLRGDSH